MKFAIERSVLVKSLAHMQNIVERRPTVSIMGNVKLVGLADSDGEWLEITATNSEVELTEKIPAKVIDPGSLTVSSFKFHEIARKINDGVQIECNQDKSKSTLQVKAGRARFQLSTLPVDDFYSMPVVKAPNKVSLAAADIKYIINTTLFAAAVDGARHSLNGIYLYSAQRSGKNKLIAAGTDGLRLACTQQPLSGDVKEIAGVIIPRKIVGELGKLLEESGATNVDVEISQTQIKFIMPNLVVTSRLIDGTYPDYEKVIPTGNDKTAVMQTAELISVIERVSVFAEKSSRIRLSFSKDKLNVSASSSDEGSAEEDLDVSYAGGSLDIAYNFKYLLDILNQTKDGRVKATFLGPQDPAIFTNPDDERARYILMPLGG
ncbi:MAG: DNA polymerase III subunit beta [Alphaproteobacteria bacterium]|nr:DNA polymerase III subunit beta [Alphaproteobacteria bacterium]